MNTGPLAGSGVLITRPVHQAHDLAAAIQAAGGRVVSFPVLEIVGRDVEALRRDFAALTTPDIVIFVSSNAVTYGFAVVREADAELAAIGPATRNALLAMGASVRIFPEDTFDSEHLLQHAALQNLQGLNIVIVRGQDGREHLADALRSRGANVDYLCAYRREVCVRTPGEIAALEAALRAQEIHFISIMSAATLTNLLRIMPAACMPLLRQSTLVAPSARVLQTASALLPGVSTVLAAGPQAPAIVDALIGQWQNGQNS